MAVLFALAVSPWTIGGVALGVGLLAGGFIYVLITGNTIRRARREADQVLAAAKAEGEAAKDPTPTS